MGQSKGSRARRRYSVLLDVLLIAAAAAAAATATAPVASASSHYKSHSSSHPRQHGDYTQRYSFTDEDSSSYSQASACSNHDYHSLSDDEERVLSALALLEESDDDLFQISSTSSTSTTTTHPPKVSNAASSRRRRSKSSAKSPIKSRSAATKSSPSVLQSTTSQNKGTKRTGKNEPAAKPKPAPTTSLKHSTTKTESSAPPRVVSSPLSTPPAISSTSPRKSLTGHNNAPPSRTPQRPDSSAPVSSLTPRTSTSTSTSTRISTPPILNMPPKPTIPRRTVLPPRVPPANVPPAKMAAVTATPKPAKTSSTTSTTTPWVRRYLSVRLKDVLLPVPREYLADGFNLAQLAPIVERIGFQVMGSEAVDIAKRLVQLPGPQPSYPIYRLALQLLLNENEANEAAMLQHPLIPPQAIQEATEALYLMVHARFVASPRGLDALRRILVHSPVFGKCPRIKCRGTTLLPYGASNDYTGGTTACQRYCPSCGNLWQYWDSKTDGCAWGPGLSHLLLLAHGIELYARQAAVAAATRPRSVVARSHPNPPTILGFRIHPASTWGLPLSEA